MRITVHNSKLYYPSARAYIQLKVVHWPIGGTDYESWRGDLEGWVCDYTPLNRKRERILNKEYRQLRKREYERLEEVL